MLGSTEAGGRPPRRTRTQDGPATAPPLHQARGPDLRLRPAAQTRGPPRGGVQSQSVLNGKKKTKGIDKHTKPLTPCAVASGRVGRPEPGAGPACHGSALCGESEGAFACVCVHFD